jgi:hypothetical protein
MKDRLFILFLVTFLLQACDITDIGNPSSSDTGGTDDNCTVKSKHPIDWTETSELGVSPEGVFGDVSGSCEAPFEWNGAGFSPYLVVDPQSGESVMQVSIETDTDSAVFVNNEVAKDGPTHLLPGSCPDVLEVTAQVSLESSNGVFKGEWSVTVSYQEDSGLTDDELVSIEIEEDTEDFEGTLRVELSQEDIKDVLSTKEESKAILHIYILPIQTKCAGSMSLSYETVSGSAGFTGKHFGSWPPLEKESD